MQEILTGSFNLDENSTMFTRVNLIYIIVVCLLNVNQAFRYKYHTNNSDISRNVLKDELFLNQSGSTKFFDKHKIESNIYSFPTKLSYNDNVMKNRNTDFNTAQDDKNYYSDWTPIISSSFKPFIPRKQFTLTLKNEPLNKKKEVDKSQQWLKDNIKENFTFSSPENSKNNKSSIKLFPYQRNSINWRNDNKSELNLTMNNFSSVKRSDKNIFTKPNITRRKTKVTLNEDDIMWMHYSLPNQNIPLIRSYQENSKNNSVMTENQENFEAEEIMKSRITDTVVEKQKEQTKQHKLEGQQFTYSADNTNFLNYIKNNTKEYRNNYQNDGKLLSHQEVYYRTKNYIKPNHVHNFSLPKNIYDVIDGKNWSDQFEPITEATNKYDSNGLEYSNDRKDVNNKFGYADILVKHRKDETKKKEDDWSTWLNLYEIKYNLNNETNEPSQRHESELFTFSPIPSVRTIMTTTSKSIIEKTLTGVSKEKNVKNYETRNLIKYDQKNNSFTNLQDENRYYVKKEDDEYDKSKRNFSQWSNGDDDKINFQNSSSIWLNENGKKDTINNSGKKKRKNLGKFLNKPIVIVESQTNLTAEYYRQLFESFGSHDDDDVDKLASSRKNLEKLPGKYMEQRESSTLFSPEANLRHENMVSLSTTAESENCNQNCVESEKCENTDKKHSPSKPGKKHSVSDIFFNITRTELGDLIPKTLKTNIYSLKHLIIECHSNSKEKRSLIMEHPFYCLKKITLDILDKAITSDVVQITDTVSLIKENHNSSNESRYLK